MREVEECGMEEFGTLEGNEKTIAILGDRWWPRAAEQEGDKISKQCFHVIYGNTVTSAQVLEVSLLEAGTVFRLERDTWSMAK